jgi:polyhydroxyalkanoate synthesis regulator phasin
MEEQFDSFDKVSKKLKEQDDKFANQYDETVRLKRKVESLERQLASLEKRSAA